MSYELRVSAPRGLDLEPLVTAGAEDAGGELVWERETLVAQLLPLGDALEVGVVSDGPAAERGRDFRELLGLLLAVAARGGGAVHDRQLGRELGSADLDEAVRFFG
jgi:hypothetical protein